eukprot:m.274172 g.274172  ORF g.274172 m.274172 type:complete len:101 (+) comp40584_c0_seq8:2536-2838(+)
MLKLVQELLWLLNSRPGWQLPFAHVAPAYHRRCDKQLKLKEYGVSKRIDLLELPRVSQKIQITGTGNQRLVVLREREVTLFKAGKIAFAKGELSAPTGGY